MPVRLPLSVVIIALNEEQRIGDCLASVSDLAGDLVVVDAQSEDRTAEVAAEAGARVLVRSWTGYSDQKNFGNDAARYDWILSLDADERVSSELAASIRREFERGPRHEAYAIRFENFYCGKVVRFGAWNPESHVRLFDRRKLQWNSDEVHEGLRAVEGTSTGKLAGQISHLTVTSPGQLALKTERYSALFAEKLRRRRRRPPWWKIWLNPLFRFFRDYFLRGGLLDGRAGFAIAWESARYTHLKYWLALPAPTTGPRWTAAWTTALATAMVAILLVVKFAQKPAGEEGAEGGSANAAGLVAAMDTFDGFDNNPMTRSRRQVVDDEVLL